MVRKKVLLLSSFFLLVILFQASPVNAHTPGPMTLDYDFGTQTLTVDITHDVADINTHYIVQVVVEKNSVQVLTRGYTSQNTTSGFSAIYQITAVHGDILSVRADCVISGFVTGDETVVDPSVTTTTTPTNGEPTPLDMTLIIAVAIVAIGVVAVIFAVFRRR